MPTVTVKDQSHVPYDFIPEALASSHVIPSMFFAHSLFKANFLKNLNLPWFIRKLRNTVPSPGTNVALCC